MNGVGLRSRAKTTWHSAAVLQASGSHEKAAKEIANLEAGSPAHAPEYRPISGRTLARISHQVSTAAADPGMSTALRAAGLLDVLSSTPAEPSGRAPCIHARLRRLATKPGEKCGLRTLVLMSAVVCMSDNLVMAHQTWLRLFL